MQRFFRTVLGGCTRKAGIRFPPAVLGRTPVMESILRLPVHRTRLGSFKMAAGAAPILEETHHVKGIEEFALIFEDHPALAFGTWAVSAHIQYYHGFVVS